MDFSFNGEPWKDLVRKAREAADSGIDAVKAKAERAGMLADAAKEYYLLQKLCHTLAEEINTQMASIGEMIYMTYKGQPAGSEVVQEALEHLDRLFSDLREARAKIGRFKGELICSACGAENAPESLYCHNCGRPLNFDTV